MSILPFFMWTESDRRQWADKQNDERPTIDERHIVVIYNSDSVETAIRLEAQAREHGWTILYREVTR